MTTLISGAKLKVELSADAAEATLSELERRIKEAEGAMQAADKESRDNQRRRGRQVTGRGDLQGKDKQDMDSTGPGRFGIKNLPNLLNAPEVAGITAGAAAFATKLALAPAMAAGGPGAAVASTTSAVVDRLAAFARPAAGLTLQYGGLATGILEGISGEFGPGGKSGVDAAMAMINPLVKGLQSLDARLRALEPTVDRTMQLTQAQLVAGGTVDVGFLKQFATWDYDIERTMNQRDQDRRWKLQNILGNALPGFFGQLIKTAQQQ